MSRHQRLNDMLRLLSERGNLEVDEAVSELGVSAATVRRDFDQLAAQQLVTRTHGGAVPTGASYDLPLRYKIAREADAKLQIAHAAADMINPGETVGLNGGTTTTEVARALVSHSLTGDGEHLAVTVVTNALNIATELAVRPQVKIVVIGGVARPQSYELIGPLTDAILAQVNINTVFLGADAIDPQQGAMAHHEGEASVNRHLVERAERVIVVADRTKHGNTAFANICGPEFIDVLLTDQDPGEKARALWAEHDVEVMVAPPRQ